MIQSFRGKIPQTDTSAFIAPDAAVIGDVRIKKHSSVWFHVTIRADINSITIGEYTNIQDSSVLHVTDETHGNHDLVIGNHVTVGHSAILHGCRIGDNCLIGMGACILDGAEIGDGCIIGAKALVTEGKKIPAGSMVMGIPAKVVRQLTSEEIAGLVRHAENYALLASEYLGG